MLIRLSDSARLYHADCRDAIKSLPDNSIDSVVTDPPYALVSIVKRFGSPNAAPAKGNDAYMRASAGFMGKQWDTGEVAFSEEFWAEVLRVLKPGGHIAAFGASRGYHRMACAIEDAGFEIRDSLMWVYGTGFPKSQNVAKFIDKEFGVKGSLGGPRSAAHAAMLEAGVARRGEKHEGWDRPWMDDPEAIAAAQSTYIPASPEAQKFDGFGTALKPAFEPIVLARKPLSEGTVAANVLRWGTGALNIDGCRVPTDETIKATRNVALGSSSGGVYGAATTPGVYVQKDEGRWPANVVHDGSDEVVGAFPNTSSGKAAVGGHKRKDSLGSNSTVNIAGRADENAGQLYGDSGSAARFFYSAKASKADRNGSKHPTVKPIALMEWLATLITPPGGTILDPFAGSGTTGAAAARRGFRCVLVEREDEYVEDIKRRFGARPVDPLARLLAWNRAVASYRAGKSKVAA
jgi:site-specific DNA-methyltransferase (adenine-specific)